jgi:hypothetical protein
MKSPPGAAVFEFATTVFEVTGVAFTTFTFVRFVELFAVLLLALVQPIIATAANRIERAIIFMRTPF